MKKMKQKIHYISEDFNPIFIIARTSCGKHWQDVNESTSNIKYVTCEICLKKIKDETNKRTN